MATKRTLQIAEEIKAQVATMLVTGKISDPRLRSITIQEVKVSPDLQQVRIFYSCYDENIDPQSVSKGFTSANSLIRRAIGERLQMRFTPSIHFEMDKTIAHAAKIHKILNEVRADYQSEDTDSSDTETKPQQETPKD